MSAEDRQIVALSKARRMLAEAKTVDEAKHVLDLVVAAQTYAKRAQLSQEIRDEADELRLRWERKLGEILARTVRAKGTDRAGRGIDRRRARQSSVPPTLSELGITRTLSARAQKIASMPAATFERAVAEGKRAGDLSVARVLVDQRRKERHEEIARAAAKSVGLPEVTSRYAVLLADPPWRYRNEAPTSRASNQYPTMATEAICALEVPAADDAALYLWTTSPHLPEALEVMDAWGFEYRSSMVWVKAKAGQGYWARIRHEFLLVGARGRMSPPEPSRRADSVIEAPQAEHSTKPVAVYELIERAYPGLPRVELFARSAREGWARWGYEA